MKRLLSLLLSLAIGLPLPPALAQQSAPSPAYSQAELDQMLAPIALYPDSLLSQVLMAATYPLEVVEAARWSRAHPGLKGDEAVRTADDKDWDPSIKSLLAFPELLQRMDEKLEWTKELGDAFLAQEAQVMDAVQRLRQRARAAGHLLDDGRVRVADDGGAVVIEYADPRVVYVPYYDPLVVYGGWWWPAYPPVLWAPWPGYVVVRPGFWWGAGVGVTAGFFFGAVSWPHRHVKVVHTDVYYVRPRVAPRTVVVHRPIAVGTWRHDPSHRRGATYRHREVRQRYAAPAAPGAPSRPFGSGGATEPAKRREFRREERREERRNSRHWERRGQLMPPAWRSSATAPARATPRETPAPATAPTSAVPYDRRHGRPSRTLDRPDRGRGARADAAQHRAAKPHGFARNAGRDAGAFSVRPPVRFGVARDRPRMAR